MNRGALLFVTAATAVVNAQDTPTFRSTTRLVEASVSISDAAGKPILGLTKADVTLTAGGRSRPLAFLQFDGLTGATHHPPPLPKHVFTNRPEFSPAESRNVTAIVIDSLNSNPFDDQRLRGQILGYLRRLQPGSRVALYQLASTFRVLHDFTQDPEDIRRRLATANLNRLPGAAEDAASLQADAQALLSALGPSGAQFQEGLDRMLAAERELAGIQKANRMQAAFTTMRALARHLAGVPGRKNLIWAGGGIPFIYVAGTLGDSRSTMYTFGDWIQSAARALAAANVVLYYFDTRGVVAPAANAASNVPTILTETQRLNEEARIGTRMLATLTGGRYVNYSNNVETAFEAAQADQRASYTLAFYADDDLAAKWTPLTIKVNRPGVRVHHREGFQFEREAAAHQGSEAVRAVLVSPLGTSSILMNARCEPDPAAAAGAVRLFVQIDAETLPSREGRLEVTVAEVNAEGRMFTYDESASYKIADKDWPRVLQEGIPYTRRWIPRAGTQRLRVLVRAGEPSLAGTIDIPMRQALAP